MILTRLQTPAQKPANRPFGYKYRGKTVTNNGEKETLVKYTSFDSLLKGAGLDDNPAFLAEIKLFYDPNRPNRPYTMDDFLEVLDRACDWLFPHLSREQGREELGRLTFEGFRKTLHGKMALAALHIIGPDKLARYAPGLFNDTVTQTERTVTQLGPRQYLYSIRNASGTPEEVVGLLKAGLQAAGARNVRCRVEQPGASAMDFYVEWD